MKQEAIKKNVRQGYARIAKGGSSCCGGTGRAESIGKQIGYSDKEMSAVPEGANLGLGCGNPVALASLKKGDVVLDLGSGAGFDCFLAAKKVGAKGKVIGVDMTPEMLERARENGRKGNYRHVEFRLGEIENLPAPDNSVDVVISNCVINLSPDKEQVFREAFRVLKPGGVLMVSDIVLLKKLPGFIKQSIEAYIGCLSGAMLQTEYLKTIDGAGFRQVKIVDAVSFPIDCMANDPTGQAVVKNLKIPREKLDEVARSVVSIKVRGVKTGKKS